MKKTTLLFAFIATMLISITGCKNEKSYSELQDLEQVNIKSYIKRKNINVVTDMPTQWQPSTYYKSSSGLYFHLIEEGNEAIQLNEKSNISVRFIVTKIDEKESLLLRNWEPMDFVDPLNVRLIDASSNNLFGIGVYEAIRYMKYQGAEARIIVPSEINTSEYKNTVTPVTYHLKITRIQ